MYTYFFFTSLLKPFIIKYAERAYNIATGALKNMLSSIHITCIGPRCFRAVFRKYDVRDAVGAANGGGGRRGWKSDWPDRVHGGRRLKGRDVNADAAKPFSVSGRSGAKMDSGRREICRGEGRARGARARALGKEINGCT